MIRRDLNVAAVLVIAAGQRPIRRRIKVEVGPFMVNGPREILNEDRTVRVISITRNGCAFEVCYAHRLTRRFNSELLIMMAITTRVVNRMRNGFTFRFLPFNDVHLPI